MAVYKAAFEYIMPIAVRHNLSTKSQVRPLIEAFQAGARFIVDGIENDD